MSNASGARLSLFFLVAIGLIVVACHSPRASRVALEPTIGRSIAADLYGTGDHVVILFAHGGSDQRSLSMSWLGVLVVVVAVLGALFALVVYLGGIPPVHEWSAVIRGGGK